MTLSNESSANGKGCHCCDDGKHSVHTIRPHHANLHHMKSPHELHGYSPPSFEEHPEHMAATSNARQTYDHLKVDEAYGSNRSHSQPSHDFNGMNENVRGYMPQSYNLNLYGTSMREAFYDQITDHKHKTKMLFQTQAMMDERDRLDINESMDDHEFIQSSTFFPIVLHNKRNPYQQEIIGGTQLAFSKKMNVIRHRQSDAR